MAKASTTAGVVVTLLCVVLLLSSAVTTTEAGRHLGTGRRDDGAAVMAGAGRPLGNKVIREEEMEASTTDGATGAAGVGESKRRSPGGPDPQHH
ncbi:hypothetical protein ZEAMMB73_Zm00001d038997 [Zea mays]|jgi:hypothetical protein|uniref:Uncharacterized protein n=1 Tax=Zea mays TaxID=4577 RepID=A0A1D6MCI2_MAIZE|nr:hypothetical protein ZEAMMB73_Zm00001d038997 [Zea mays]